MEKHHAIRLLVVGLKGPARAEAILKLLLNPETIPDLISKRMNARRAMKARGAKS